MEPEEIVHIELNGGFRKLSLAYSVALSGNYAKVDTWDGVGIIAEKLQQAGQHKGVIIACCNPWLVSVMRE